MKREKLEIPTAIMAEIAERAYRRGFQQGYTAAEREQTVIDLWKWRYKTSAKKAVNPENGKTFWSIPTSLERLEIEERDVLEKLRFGS